MCKEDIRIARKFGYNKKVTTVASNALITLTGSRPDRVRFAFSLQLSLIDSFWSIGGNIDPPTGNVAESVKGLQGGLAFITAGDEGTIFPLFVASWGQLNGVLRIEDYGPILTEQIRITFGSVGGGTINWVETWVEQELDEL